MLGQNFARSAGIEFLDRDNLRKNPYGTSWGFSTRMVGATIMAHGDDAGLVLPPNVAPHQVVVVPIFRGDDECEKEINADTGATIRLVPFDSPNEAGTCLVDGRPSERRVLFARAY